MSRRGAHWYKREPHAYLGGVRGLSAKQHAVYSIILDLIYDHGGVCPNDPKWISGWISDMGSAAVRGSILHLCDMGKLADENDVLTNPRATIEAKTDKELRENRSKTGEIGGRKSAELRREARENNGLTQPSASTMVQPDKRREEKKEERATDVAPKRGSRLLDDWTLPKLWGVWALEQGLPRERVRVEAQKFRNYWTAKAGQSATKRNWQRTWENWVLTALERTPQQRTNGDDRFARKMQMARSRDERAEADGGMDNGAGGGDLLALPPAQEIG